jgi:GNAT superfamily N-acetyltransferase
VTRHGPDTAREQLAIVRELYAEVYAEPPYFVGPAEVAEFVAGWQQRVAEPGFRLVLGHWDDRPVGFAFGAQLQAQAGWWQGALTPLSPQLTAEHPGRTFALLEIGVRRPYRGRGVARRMHDCLIDGRSEERVALLVLPDAPVPRQAYLSWGYRPVGRVRPFPGGPIFDAMVKPLGQSAVPRGGSGPE